MRILIVAAITLLAGAARADTSPIIMPGMTTGGSSESTAKPPPEREATKLGVGAIDGGTLDRMAVAIEATPTGVHATWTLDVSTTSRGIRELVIPLAVSNDVAITGLQLSLAGGEPLVGEKLESVSAVVGYNSFVELAKDPALLEWVGTKGSSDELRLRVFPVAKGAPATITIEMWLAGGNQLELDPGRRRVAEVAITDPARSATWKKLGVRRTWTLPMIELSPPAEPEDIRGVTQTSSLVAGPYSLRSGPSNSYSTGSRRLSYSFHEHVPVTPQVVAAAEDL